MIGYDYGAIAMIFGALFLFGFFYDRVVGWLIREGYAEGYISLLVGLGSTVTLMGVILIDWQAGILALGAFLASGFWMILGSVNRYVQARRADQENARQS